LPTRSGRFARFCFKNHLASAELFRLQPRTLTTSARPFASLSGVLPVSGRVGLSLDSGRPPGHAWVPREWVAAHPSHSCCRRCGHSLPPYQTAADALAAPSRASGGHSHVLRSAVVALFLIDRQPRYQVLHAAVARPPATFARPSCSALRTTRTSLPLVACTIAGTPLPPTAVTPSPSISTMGAVVVLSSGIARIVMYVERGASREGMGRLFSPNARVLRA